MIVAAVLHRGAESSLHFFVLSELVKRGYQPRLFDWRSPPPQHAFDGAEIIVLVRYWPLSWRWWCLLLQAKRQGRRCIYFMDDDLFCRQAFSALPHRYARRLWMLAFCQRARLMRWCDEFWVSSQALVARYTLHRPQLLPLRPVPELRQSSQAVEIAYHGTGCHRAELVWLFPVLAQVLQAFPQTTVELYGDDAIASLYAPLKRVRVHRPLLWEQYRELTALQQLDIWLCPLLNHSFNTCRAPVKYLDAARLGAAGLYSCREPYRSFVHDQEDGLLLADDQSVWIQAITRLIEQPEQRRRLVSGAQHRVAREFSGTESVV